MAFELPTLPFPIDSRGTPFIASPDSAGKYTAAASQWFKNASNLWVPVSASDPLPTTDAAAQSILTAIRGYIDGLEAALGEVAASPTAYTVLARLKDLADRLGEVSAAPTANTVLARLKTLEGYLDGVEAVLGTTADLEAAGDGSIIAVLKRIRTLVAQGIVTLGSAAGSLAVLVAGSDGTNARALKTATDGTLLTQLTGSFLTMRTPVTGIKTVTATAAEIFAGASRLTGRRRMVLKNEDPVLRFRIGSASVTQANGFPVEPLAVVVLDFDPTVDVPVYAISEGGNLGVAVMEI